MAMTLEAIMDRAKHQHATAKEVNTIPEAQAAIETLSSLIFYLAQDMAHPQSEAKKVKLHAKK